MIELADRIHTHCHQQRAEGHGRHTQSRRSQMADRQQCVIALNIHYAVGYENDLSDTGNQDHQACNRIR